MKKFFVLIVGLNFCFANAQNAEDPIVMKVADIEVPLSEFLFLAKKDSEVDLLNKKSLENYVELFKNFKLKVADAQSLRIQESITFQEEFSNYYGQLMDSYLYDREGETKAMRSVYERGKEILALSHIVFRLPDQSLPKDTLEVYNRAYEVYQRLLAGEDFTAVGQAFEEDENSGANYEDIDYLFPLQSFRTFEDAAYAMKEGEISAPVRTPIGFHIIRLNRKITDPGHILVAQILIQVPEFLEGDEEALLEKTNEVYQRVLAGEDFTEMVLVYSSDENTRDNGGMLPYFGLGNMVLPFEQAAFSLKTIGDVSEPVRTRLGYHIIKLLDKRDYPAFDDVERTINAAMKQGEWNHELRKTFDERLKAKFGFIFYPEAYGELLSLCQDYFPNKNEEFYEHTSTMTKPIMHMYDRDFPQYEFGEYVRLKPLSYQTYSEDYLNEMFLFFVREIVTALEKRELEERNPDFRKLMSEYHDGILLFEVSSSRVWNHPVEEQAKLEQEWIKELNKRFKVTINWKVLNNLKKYLK